ncbi:DUF507 family protein [Candidatus Nitrospira neomarina]|jgi:uncharacterized protein|uniref:DUF507 family protein n=1 Tax=Candidatus Nitrospira neomarina TaxID=3020899 RepID=A0AA96JX25_9BACT|nr:DUF507 family protein [Candidatus Nitrospira neomarina]WNM63462.1 DUF507 family protein [Candidatus Nitrospira neomarina]
MRLNKVRVHHMAVSVIERLQSSGLLQIQGKPEVVIQKLEAAILSELQVEDRLNADVREMLKQFEREFAEGRADYQKMFTMVKQKLIKERGVIL